MNSRDIQTDMVLYSELPIPFEDAIEEAFQRRKLKHAELVVEARQHGCQAHASPVEIGVWVGFVFKSTTTLLSDFDFRARLLKGALKELCEAAEKVSQWLWLRCLQTRGS